jgi:hypothetical protein
VKLEIGKFYQFKRVMTRQCRFEKNYQLILLKVFNNQIFNFYEFLCLNNLQLVTFLEGMCDIYVEET